MTQHSRLGPDVVRVTATGPDYAALPHVAIQLGSSAWFATEGEDAAWRTPSGKKLGARRMTEVVPHQTLQSGRGTEEVISWEADFWVGPLEEWTE